MDRDIERAVDSYAEDPSGNNVVATGALFMVLTQAMGVQSRLNMVALLGGNQLEVGFAFLGSHYRVTVERIRDEPEYLHVETPVAGEAEEAEKAEKAEEVPGG